MKISAYIRDAALVGIFIFLWNVNARLVSIETTLKFITAGKVEIAAKP